mmetsp:Transcript_15894/g.26741  ORF Transcript_15894/g.26741 Transcript_15894/m.26741 type:complete len:602 (-) Transcript_15894:751-2556(-)
MMIFIYLKFAVVLVLFTMKSEGFTGCFKSFLGRTPTRPFTALRMASPDTSRGGSSLVDSLDATLGPPTTAEVGSAIALVSGTTVGAGIIALAGVSLKPGFIPSTLGLLGTWLLMTTTGLLIAEVVCDSAKRSKNSGSTFLINDDNDESNMMMDGNVNLRTQEATENEEERVIEKFGVISTTNRLLGKSGSISAGIAYVFIHYALLTAYIAEAGAVLSKQLQLPEAFATGPLLFTAVIGGIMTFGSEGLIESVNNVFFVLVLVSFLCLVALGIGSVNPSNLLHQDYNALGPIFPILLVALVYHNVVPSVCSNLRYDKASIRTAVSIGSFLPLTMFILWNAVVLGIVKDYDGTSASSQSFDPLDVLLSGQPENLKETGQILVSIFSEAAIITSFIGFVVGLMEFYGDIFPSLPARDKRLYGLVLVPPFVVALADPTIFLNAMDAAGTFGISLLFGVLPAVLAYKQRSERNGGLATMVDDREDGLELVAGALTGNTRERRKSSTSATARASASSSEAIRTAKQQEEEEEEDDLEEDGVFNPLQIDIAASADDDRIAMAPAGGFVESPVMNTTIPYEPFVPGGNASLAAVVGTVVAIIAEKSTTF